MNILFVIHNYKRPEHRLQPRLFVHEIGCELMAQGQHVSVLTDSCVETEIDGICVYGADSLRASNAAQLRTCINSISPDVVVWSMGFTNALAGSRLYKTLGVPVVANFNVPYYRTSQILQMVRSVGLHLPTYYLVNNIIRKWSVSRAFQGKAFAGIVCQSKSNIELLARMGVERHRLWHIAPGIDSNVWFATQSLLEQVSSTGYQFLFFGPARRARGLWNLIKAFASVAKDHPQARLRLFLRGADPECVAAVESECKSHGIIKQTTVTGGWQSAQELREAITESYAVVIPFVVSESDMPVSVLEAKACCRPIISTNIASIIEMVGKGGITVPTNSYVQLARAMNKIIEDCALYQRLCQNCIKEMRGYPTWGECATVFMRGIRDVIRT